MIEAALFADQTQGREEQIATEHPWERCSLFFRNL